MILSLFSLEHRDIPSPLGFLRPDCPSHFFPSFHRRCFSACPSLKSKTSSFHVRRLRVFSPGPLFPSAIRPRPISMLYHTIDDVIINPIPVLTVFTVILASLKLVTDQVRPKPNANPLDQVNPNRESFVLYVELQKGVRVDVIYDIKWLEKGKHVLYFYRQTHGKAVAKTLENLDPNVSYTYMRFKESNFRKICAYPESIDAKGARTSLNNVDDFYSIWDHYQKSFTQDETKELDQEWRDFVKKRLASPFVFEEEDQQPCKLCNNTKKVRCATCGGPTSTIRHQCKDCKGSGYINCTWCINKA